MNIRAAVPDIAEDDMRRVVFTHDDYVKMVEAGIFESDTRIELIEGDFVPMQAKANPHEQVKLGLVRRLSRYLPDTLQLGVETTCHLSGITFVDPDLSVFPIEIPTDKVRAADVLLMIEVAHTTINKDLKVKAKVYAKYGVQEYWVIDVKERVTHVHTAPTPEGYASIAMVAADTELSTPMLPGFSCRLGDYA